MLTIFAQGHTVGNGQARMGSSGLSPKPMLVNYSHCYRKYINSGQSVQGTKTILTVVSDMILVSDINVISSNSFILKTLSPNQYTIFFRHGLFFLNEWVMLRIYQQRIVKDWKTVSFQKLHSFLQRKTQNIKVQPSVCIKNSNSAQECIRMIMLILLNKCVCY